MKIIYLSDNYGHHNYGTKLSIYEELLRRGHDAQWLSVHMAGRNRVDGEALSRIVRESDASWVFVAHSWVEFVRGSLRDVHDAGARVLGFGFSDPYGWDARKLANYDGYATNHFETHDRLQENWELPVTMFPTAGHAAFHRDLGMERDIDVLVYGAGNHSRFRPKSYRVDVMRELCPELERRGMSVQINGSGWGDLPSKGPIVGEEFLRTVNRAKVVLDLQQEFAPNAHRMFEALFCGTAVVTRARSEVDRLLEGWPVPAYTNLEDLLSLTEQACGEGCGDVRVVRARHDISARVESLLTWLEDV